MCCQNSDTVQIRIQSLRLTSFPGIDDATVNYFYMYPIPQPRVLWLYIGPEPEGFHVQDIENIHLVGYLKSCVS